MEEGGEEIDGLRQGLDNVVLDFNPTKKKKKKSSRDDSFAGKKEKCAWSGNGVSDCQRVLAKCLVFLLSCGHVAHLAHYCHVDDHSAWMRDKKRKLA